MDLSIFLAKVIGIIFTGVGISLLVRQNLAKTLATDFGKNKFFLYYAGALKFTVGVLLVVSHNVWSRDFALVITIIGWLELLGGAFYLLTPHKQAVKWVKKFASKEFYNIAGIAAIILGLYLAYNGFGLTL